MTEAIRWLGRTPSKTGEVVWRGMVATGPLCMGVYFWEDEDPDVFELWPALPCCDLSNFLPVNACRKCPTTIGVAPAGHWALNPRGRGREAFTPWLDQWFQRLGLDPFLSLIEASAAEAQFVTLEKPVGEAFRRLTKSSMSAQNAMVEWARRFYAQRRRVKA